MGQVSRGKTRVQGFANAEMDFQLLRQLGSATYGGAAVGQCLAAVQSIGEGGTEAWVRTFAALGQELQEDAAARAAKGHGISARDQYLNACNAWRAAEYYCPVQLEEHQRLGLASRECFLRAMEFMDVVLEPFFVPHDQASLPAYCIRPKGDPAPRKTLVAVSGYDGTMEETWFQVGAAALERGYTLCLFSGPGQMDSLRFNPGQAFEPDYERGVAALLDLLLQRPEVDPQRVGLYGISIGGYYAPRAAAFEPRIKALCANSPVVDYFAYMSGFVRFNPLTELAEADDFSLEDLEHIPDAAMAPFVKEASATLMRRFGRPTFKAAFRRIQEFRLEEHLHRIHCPCLALIGTGEGAEARRQSQIFCGKVSGPAQERLFTEAEGADAHCQIGNLRLSNAVLLDWLDETFA